MDAQLMMRSMYDRDSGMLHSPPGEPNVVTKLLQAHSRRGTDHGRPAGMPHLSLRGTDARTDAGLRENAQAAAAIIRLQHRFHPVGAAAAPREHARGTSSLTWSPVNASLSDRLSPNATAEPTPGWANHHGTGGHGQGTGAPTAGQGEGEGQRVQAAIHKYRVGMGDDNSPAAKELKVLSSSLLARALGEPK